MMRNNFKIIIQARLGSTRLPEKVLKEIGDKSLLEILLIRLSSKFNKGDICVATTNNVEDQKVYKLVTGLGYECYRGSEDDVLDRYYNCAKQLNASTIIRVTSDCPLFSPQLLLDSITKFNVDKLSYMSNVRPPTYPDGLDFSIFSFELLEEAWNSARLKSEREHVVPWMWGNVGYNGGKYSAFNLENQVDLSGLRWTVDEPEDFEYINAIYKYFEYDFLVEWQEVLRVHPKFSDVNSHFVRDEGLKKSKEKDGQI